MWSERYFGGSPYLLGLEVPQQDHAADPSLAVARCSPGCLTAAAVCCAGTLRDASMRMGGAAAPKLKPIASTYASDNTRLQWLNVEVSRFNPLEVWRVQLGTSLPKRRCTCPRRARIPEATRQSREDSERNDARCGLPDDPAHRGGTGRGAAAAAMEVGACVGRPLVRHFHRAHVGTCGMEMAVQPSHS